MSNIFKFYINSYDKKTNENILTDCYLFIKNLKFQHNDLFDNINSPINNELLNNQYKTMNTFYNSSIYESYFANCFNELDIDYMNSYNIYIHFVDEAIYDDDSIETIKFKFLNNYNLLLNTQTIDAKLKIKKTYEEIYMFGLVEEEYNAVNIFNNLTNNGSIKLSKNILYDYLINLNEQLIIQKLLETKDYYEFNDLENLKLQKINKLVSFGQFLLFNNNNNNGYNNYNFVTNPFKVTKYSNVLKTLLNSSINTNNHELLFEHPLSTNTLYISFLDELLLYNETNINLINEKYNTIKLYFPLIANENISNYDQFLQRKSEFIKKNDKFLSSYNFTDKMQVIDLLNNIEYNCIKDYDFFINEGIKTVNFNIYSKINLNLSLESLFKLLNSSCFIPFIKYNPGNKMENMYRLYSNKHTKTNNKVPYLNKSQTIKYIASIGKSNTIALVLKLPNKKLLESSNNDAKLENYNIKELYNNYNFLFNYLNNGEIYIEINSQGIINIRTTFNIPINIDKCNKFLQIFLNPIFNNINNKIINTNQLALFYSLDDFNIEILSMDYNFNINKDFSNLSKLTSIKSCLYSIFNIVNDKNKNSKIYRYKRVSNYNETDNKTAFIIELIKQKQNPIEIVNNLKNNFNIESLDDAKKIFESTIQSLNMIQNLFNYNKIKIKNNPGFKIIIENNNDLNVYAYSIDNINYIKLLKLYIKNLFYIANSNNENTNNENKKDVAKVNFINEHVKLNICKNIQSIKKENNNIYNNDIQNTEQINKKSIFDENIKDEKDNIDVELGSIISDDDNMDNNILDILLNSDDETSDNDSEDNIDSEISSNASEFSLNLEDEEEYEKAKSDKINSDVEKLESLEKPEKIDIHDDLYNKKDDLNIAKDDLNVEDSDKIEKDDVNVEDINLKTNLKAKPVLERLINYEKDMFTKMPKNSDVKLLTSENKSNFIQYSRICQAKFQPIILTDEEKENIDKVNPNSYNGSLQYTSKLGKKHHYICPRFWDINRNIPLTDEQVNSKKYGELYSTSNKKNHGNIISFIKDKNDKIIRKPGFLSNVCLPCCYKNPNQNRINSCLSKANKANKANKAKSDKIVLDSETIDSESDSNSDSDSDDVVSNFDNNKVYILNPSKFPLKKNKFGSLPNILKRFLQFDSDECKININNNYLAPGKRCLLRYGVENSENQSFIACIADAYSKYILKLKETLSIKKFKEHLIKIINIDKFITYCNGNLIQIFQSKNITQDFLNTINMDEYSNSNLYKNINTTNVDHVNLFKKIINAYNNFETYLNSNKYTIDYYYLWDIICKPDLELFPEGINLIILDITSEDKTENVKVLCPKTSYSSEFIDENKRSLILLKNDNYFEPIYAIKESLTSMFIPLVSFDYNKDELNLIEFKKVLNIIRDDINKKCLNFSSNINEQKESTIKYDFKENINLNTLINIISAPPFKYEIIYQIINYEGKIIGIVVSGENLQNFKYIPCYPSAYSDSSITVKFMDDINNEEENINGASSSINSGSYFSNYYDTKEFLTKLFNDSKERIIVKPKYKVIDNNVIVGIITYGNQFVTIDPPEEYNIDANINLKDELEELRENNYLINDTLMQTSLEKDDERINMINSIKLENGFYKNFKNTIISIINNPQYITDKLAIKNLLNNNTILYYEKLENIINILKSISTNAIIFSKYDKRILNSIKEISMCNSDCNSDFCMIEKSDVNTICKMIIPKQNLIDEEKDNETIYYAKLADEFIRFNNTHSMLFENNKYNIMNNIKYNINENEIVIYESLISNELFNKSFIIKNDIENFTSYDMFYNSSNDYIKPINSDYIKYDKSKIKLDTIQSNEKIKIKKDKLDLIKKTAQSFNDKLKITDIKTGDKTYIKTGNKTDIKTGDKTDIKTGDKTDIKTGDKTDIKTDIKYNIPKLKIPFEPIDENSEQDKSDTEEDTILEKEEVDLPYIEENFENYKDITIDQASCIISKKLKVREEIRNNFNDILYETYYKFTNTNMLCSYQLILSIIKHYYSTINNVTFQNLTIKELKESIIKDYINYKYNVELLTNIYQYNKIDNIKEYIENIGNEKYKKKNKPKKSKTEIKTLDNDSKLQDEKIDARLIENNIRNIINNENYYLTYLDIYRISQIYNLPIILVTNSIFDIYSFNSNKYLITNINQINNNYYFIKIPSKDFARGIKYYKLLHIENSLLLNIDIHIKDTNTNKLKTNILTDLQVYNDIIVNKLDELFNKNITNNGKFTLKKNITKKAKGKKYKNKQTSKKK